MYSKKILEKDTIRNCEFLHCGSLIVQSSNMECILVLSMQIRSYLMENIFTITRKNIALRVIN